MADGETSDKPAGVLPRWSTELWHDHPLWVLAGGTALALVAIVALIWPITDLIAAHDVGLIARPSRAAALQTAREAVRTQLLTLGAGLFAAGALVFTAWNVTLYRRNLSLYGDTNRITERGQVTERYTKAVEQLGSDKLDVRIGGIYALKRLASDSPDDHSTILEVLGAFVREHSHEKWPLTEIDPSDPTPPRRTRPDVQAALTIICHQEHIPYLFDLQGVHLPGANLGGAKLPNVDLQRGANLDGANLRYADLRGAWMQHAYLRGTDFEGADLTDAVLIGAHLNYAELGKVKSLRDTHLEHAHLNDAKLVGADLSKTHFDGADLTGASWPETGALPRGWKRNTLFPEKLMEDHHADQVRETDLPIDSAD